MSDNTYETPVTRTCIELKNINEAVESDTDPVSNKIVGISRIPDHRQLVPANFYDNLPKRPKEPRAISNEAATDMSNKTNETLPPIPDSTEGENYVQMSGGIQRENALTADIAGVDVRGTMYDTLPEKVHVPVCSENVQTATPKPERPKRPNMRLPNVPNDESHNKRDIEQGVKTPQLSKKMNRGEEKGVKTPHVSMKINRDEEKGVKTPHVSMKMNQDEEQGEKTPQVSRKVQRDEDDRCTEKDTAITVPVLKRMLSLCLCVFVIGVVVGVGLTLVVMLTKLHMEAETVVVVRENSRTDACAGSNCGSAATISPGVSNTVTVSSGSNSTVNLTSSSTVNLTSSSTSTLESSSTVTPTSSSTVTTTSNSTATTSLK